MRPSSSPMGGGEEPIAAPERQEPSKIEVAGLRDRRSIDGTRLTIELIGPPACGKTTLAIATAAQLKRFGFGTEVTISARPNEPTGTYGPAATSRIIKLAGAISQSLEKDPEFESLIRLFPIRNRLIYLRHRNYFRNLSTLASAEGLLVQDQGYVCAVAALSVDSGGADERTLQKALDLVPLPDLVVRLCVPEQTAVARLEQRLGRMGYVERLLERKVTDNRLLEDAYETIDELLKKRMLSVLHVSGRDQTDLEAAVKSIVSAVTSLRSPKTMKAPSI